MNVMNQVKVSPLSEVTRVIEPEDPSVDFLNWIRSNKNEIEEMMIDSPAILFRGFQPVPLIEVCRVFSEPMDYMYQSTPRTLLGKGLYTATEYDAESEIPQHCENAYQNIWPLQLFFYCEKSAPIGGETPLSDIRKVTAEIPSEIRQKFKEKGVLYVRNYSPGLDLPWQTAFQTTKKEEVEKYCRNNGIKVEWTDADSLKTSQVCQGLANHPVTGEELWFNQAHLFHVSSLDPEIREYLLQEYSEAGLPRSAYYGDGEPIGDEVLNKIRGAYEKFKFAFSWQDHDFLIIDNMLCSHGRKSFDGDRRMFVSMGRPVRGELG